jgi:hypothetical protein
MVGCALTQAGERKLEAEMLRLLLLPSLSYRIYHEGL